MAEPGGPGPVAFEVAERDLLLATKLHVPSPRPGVLPRPRLWEALAEGATRGLTLICTPAGFGKTTLLGDWARGSRRPVVWLSLDAGDNDRARFWRYVAAALDRVCGGIAAQVAAMLRGPQQAPPEAVVTVVVNQLVRVPDPVALVLDDYHLIEDTAVHQGLGMLLERQPDQLRLVLASRADPPLPLARLRARGQLVELRAADLRFTPQEAAALLRDGAGLELPEASLVALAARTEGWVAGLQLAALSLRDRPDPAGFVEAFSGSHRFVLDYLTEEVLARQSGELLGFLLETSVLERLNGELCNALTGRADSQRLLEQVEGANLFLVPLDEVRGWWRYHQLFADLLRVRLQRERPDRVPELHRAAAVWHERHGLADEAIRHALAAGETGWAARLVERHIEALTARSELGTVERWIHSLPITLVQSRPRRLLAQAALPYVEGRHEEVETLLEHAERALTGSGVEEPYAPSVGRDLSMLANVSATIALIRADLARQRGDLERTTAFAKQGLAELTDADRALRSVLEWDLAMADWQRGELTKAEPALAQIAARRLLPSVRAWYDLGQVQRVQGRLNAALATYRQLLEIASQARHPSAALAQVGIAEVLYERDELDAALDHASKAVAICRRDVYVPALLASLAILAAIRQARGDRAGALDAIAEAEQSAPGPEAEMVSLVSVQRARLALAQGQVADVAHWAQERHLGSDDQPGYPAMTSPATPGTRVPGAGSGAARPAEPRCRVAAAGATEGRSRGAAADEQRAAGPGVAGLGAGGCRRPAWRPGGPGRCAHDRLAGGPRTGLR